MRRVSLAPEGFDARFSALRRRYLYRICDDPATLDPLRRHDTVLVRGARSTSRRMDAAARSLLGPARLRGLLQAPRRAPPPCAPCSTTAGTGAADGTVEATVVADAFCHSMVRSLVGAVVPVGEGRLAVDVPREVLRGRACATPGCG